MIEVELIQKDKNNSIVGGYVTGGHNLYDFKLTIKNHLKNKIKTATVNIKIDGLEWKEVTK